MVSNSTCVRVDRRTEKVKKNYNFAIAFLIKLDPFKHYNTTGPLQSYHELLANFDVYCLQHPCSTSTSSFWYELILCNKHVITNTRQRLSENKQYWWKTSWRGVGGDWRSLLICVQVSSLDAEQKQKNEPFPDKC